MQQIYALVDANNFYASCERVFRPDLKHRPIAVLSNNDGCIVARSAEVKKLGIGAGTPLYQVKDLIKEHNIAVFSSNYPLYGDFSARIMKVIAQFSPDFDVYSIDEAFVNLSGFAESYNIEAYIAEMQERIEKWTGIPVTAGAAPTKTLAKIATHLSKKGIEKGKSFYLPEDYDHYLRQIPVEQVWGIGHGSAKKLYGIGIYSALDLKNAAPEIIRKMLSVTGSRTQAELNGISCIETQQVVKHHSILSSRSFGKSITAESDIAEAVASYVDLAAQKLRKRKLVCSSVVVFLKSNRHRKPYYFNQHLVSISTPTNATHILLQAASTALKHVFLQGIKYAKAGVLLLDLASESAIQLNLFEPEQAKNKKMFEIIDGLNDQMGRNTLKFASEGTTQGWKMKSENRSPNYTTIWDEIPTVK